MQHTMQDLIGAAMQAGFQATPRQVQDWVELGLLGQPERRGRGRGKGVSATWTDEQRGLFLTLLDHRQRVGRVALLCNIPVWTWLYFGDGYVPLPQLRRALRTWTEPNTKLSASAAREAARRMLADIDHPNASRKDRKALLDTAEGMFFHRSERLDRTILVPLIQRVMDPNRKGLPRTIGAMEYSPEAFVHLLEVRLRAVDALQGHRIDDALLHWARFANAVSRGRYQWLLAQRTTSGGTVAEARVPTMSQIAPRACLDLVTLLGLGLDMPAGTVNLSIEHPAAWKRQNLHSIVQGRVVGNGVEVSVEVRPVEEPEADK